MDNSSLWFENVNNQSSNLWFQGSNASDTQPQDNPGNWNDFMGKAETISQQRGFPVNVLASQAALESAHGTSNFAKERNNYFGYQAYDSNPDAAKSYQTPEQSINDYIDLVMSYPGVSDAVKSGNSDAVIRAIKAAGYATDPNYVSKIESLPEFNMLPKIGGQNGN